MIILGWIFFVIFVLIASFWIFTCLYEHEHTAALRSLLVCFPVAAVLFVSVLFRFPFQSEWLFLIISGFIIAILILNLPFKSPSCLRKDETSSGRVDERDALFHRFYRLKSGTAPYAAYYKMHPEFRRWDEMIRRLPDLNSPGTPGYDPVLSPLSDAFFSSVTKINRNLDPQNIRQLKPDIHEKEISDRLKTLCFELGACMAGTTRLNPAYIYSHIGRGEGTWGDPVRLNHTHAIVIAVEMRHAWIRQAPGAPVIVESARTYYVSAKIARFVAHTLQQLGYPARAHVDGNYRVMAIPVAVDAGLGELGRHGLLITPRFGSRVRLSVVTTSLPLEQDKPITFGVQDFCEICGRCASVCPSRAISRQSKSWVRGVEKWQSRQTSCYHFWRQNGTDCGLCIRICPYSHPDSILHRLVRQTIQRNPLTRRLAVWADSLVYGQSRIVQPPG